MAGNREPTYAGWTCKECEHEDYLHTNFVFECVARECNCEAMR